MTGRSDCVAEESLEVFPNDAVTRKNLAAAYNNIAVAEGSRMELSERIANLEASLKLDPKNEATTGNLSNLLAKEAVREFKGGDPAKVIELLERAAKIDPTTNWSKPTWPRHTTMKRLQKASQANSWKRFIFLKRR